MISLQDSIDELYRIAVIEKRTTSTLRLSRLADMCIQDLELRGIGGAEKEVVVPGIGRDKKWDVAWRHDGKARLGISLKSLLSNIAGAVPNRADDLMGEMANVQLLSPEIVTGYVMVFNVDPKFEARGDGRRWVDVFGSYVEQLSGRRAPAWAAGMVEAAVVVEVDFSGGPFLVSPQTLDPFFDRLADSIKQRNPGIMSGHRDKP